MPCAETKDADSKYHTTNADAMAESILGGKALKWRLGMSPRKPAIVTVVSKARGIR